MPHPIIQADIELHRRFATPKAFSSTVELGGLTVPGELFFEAPLPEDRSPQRAVRMFDASSLPTGYYPYKMQVTSHYEESRVSSNFSGGLLIHNNMDSPFGCGWSLVGLECLHEHVDGTVVLDTGDGQLLAFLPSAGNLDYPDFSNLDALQLNGDAERIPQDGVVLRLNQRSGAGSAFYNRPIPLTSNGSPNSFQAQFAFRLSDPAGIPDPDGPGADGLVFTLASTPGALGRSGGDLGYGGISPSIGVEVDTWWNSEYGDPNGNHIGVNIGGSLRSIETSAFSPRFNDGDIWNCWIDYDGAQTALNVYVSANSTRPDSPLLTTAIDIAGAFGAPEVYAGFTAASASATNKHDILSWQMSWGDPTSGPRQHYSSPRGEFSQLTKNEVGTFERTFLSGSKNSFRSDGQQTQHVDSVGNITLYQYDDQNRLTSITDPVGLETRFNYKRDGLLDSVIQPITNAKTTFVHDGIDLVGIRDPDGSERDFRYDDQHRLIAQQDQEGYETRYVYGEGSVLREAIWSDSGDTRGYAISRAIGALLDPSGTTLESPQPIIRSADATLTELIDRRDQRSSVKTGPLGGLVEFVDPLNNKTTLERNPDGQVVRTVSPRNRVDTYRYDGDGNLLELIEGLNLAEQRSTSYTYVTGTNWIESVTDGDNHTTRFEYDDQGNLERVIHQDLSQRRIESNGSGLPELVIDENNNRTRYTYDALGQLLEIENAFSEVTRYERDDAGNVTRILEGVGTSDQRSRRFTYDQKNRVLSATDGENETTTFRYDNRGLLVETRLPEGEIISRSYDSRGRLTTIEDPLRGQTTLRYDSEDNLTRREDQNGLVTRYGYDFAGRLERVTDPDGNIEEYTYDPSGNIDSFTNANRHTTRFEFDLLERRTGMITPESRRREWRYDRRDNLTREILPDNATIVHQYDSRSRRTQTDVPSVGMAPANTIQYAYDNVGNLRFVSDNDTRLERQYDRLNRVKKEITLAGGSQPTVTLINRYDSVGNRDSLADGELTHFYEHDDAGRLTSVRTNRIGRIDISYDRNGRMVETLFPNRITASMTYGSSGRLTQILYRGVSGPPLLDLDYEYGPTGNIRAITDSGIRKDYDYDRLDRLTSSSGSGSESYDYDPVGNRELSHLSNTHTHNRDNQLLEDQGASYSYDLRGNLSTITDLASKSTDTLVWDAQNQLVEAIGIARYRYDGLGRRVEKRLEDGTTRRYVYDGENIHLEFDESDRLIARYTHGEQVDHHLAMEREGQAAYYHTDHLGSTRGLSNGTGTLVNQYDYDSYGQLLGATEGLVNPYLYTGREDAREIDAYYYRARWYSPERGRFSGEDPLQFEGSDSNLYEYANSSPLYFVDPSGEVAWVCGALVITYAILNNPSTANAPGPDDIVNDDGLGPELGMLIDSTGGAVLSKGLRCLIPKKRSLDDILRETKPLQNKKTRQRTRSGGERQMRRDFNAIPGRSRSKGNGVRHKRLPDGTNVSARPNSKGGDPTLQISPPKGRDTKIRYK